MFEPSLWKRFCEYISKLLGGGDMFDGNGSIGDKFTYVMVIDFNVFTPGMENWIC